MQGDEETCIAGALAVSRLGTQFSKGDFIKEFLRIIDRPLDPEHDSKEQLKEKRQEADRIRRRVLDKVLFQIGAIQKVSAQERTRGVWRSLGVVEPMASMLLAFYGLQLDISNEHKPPLQLLLGTLNPIGAHLRFGLYKHLLSAEGQEPQTADNVFAAIGVKANPNSFSHTLDSLRHKGVISYEYAGNRKAYRRITPAYMAPISELVQGEVLLGDNAVAEAYRDRARDILGKPALVTKLLTKHREYMMQLFVERTLGSLV